LTSRSRHCFLEVSYGGSVAMRLSTFRRSRFCAYETCSVFRCPFVLFRVHYPPFIGGGGVHEDWGLMFFRCRSFRHGLTDASDHHARTRVQQLASFTMHTGLAEQLFTCLLGFSAFPTCYFPLCVSAPGRLDVLEVLTPFLSRVTREFHMHRHGAPSRLVHPGQVQIRGGETHLVSAR
jgi:hypothetical protein